MAGVLFNKNKSSSNGQSSGGVLFKEKKKKEKEKPYEGQSKPLQPMGQGYKEVKSAKDTKAAEVLDYIFQSNPVAKVLNYPFAKAAEYSIPTSPMIKDGKAIAGTNAREEHAKRNPVKSTGNKTLDKVGDAAGHIGSIFTPIGTGGALISDIAKGSSAILSSKLGQKAIEKTGKLGSKTANALNPALNTVGINVSTNLAKKAGENLVKGGVLGGAYGAVQPFAHGSGQMSDVPGSVAENAVMFGTGDAALPFAGAGLKIIGSKFAGTKIGDAIGSFFTKPKVAEPSQPTLALPEGRLRGNANTAITPDTIYAQEAGPRGLPQPNIGQPTTARIRPTTGNEYTNKLEKLFEEANQTKFTPGREMEELESLWSHRAGPNDPSLNDLIDLAYPKQTTKVNADSLSQARELQRSREVAGAPNKVKSMDDRYTPFVGKADAPIERVGRSPQVEITPPKTKFAPVESVKPEPTQTGGVLFREKKAMEARSQAEAIDDVIQTKEPRMRDKIHSALDEAEKAARVRLAAKKNTLSSMPLDQYADHAIILAAKVGKAGIKLADATEILVKEFGEEIRPHAQAIYNQARGIVSDTERRATKQAQEAKAFNESTTGTADTFRGKVSRDIKGNKTTIAKRYEAIRTSITDDLAPLEGLEKRIRGKLASAEDSLYKSARLFRGMPAKAHQIVQEKLIPVIQSIEKTGHSIDDLGDYALAVHSRDVNARDIKSGFTNKEIEDTIRKFGTPEMEAARKELVKLNDDMLKQLVDADAISQELVDALRKRYPNYMPLFREMNDEAVEFTTGMSNALANVTAPIKGLKGSEKKVIDPFENMVKNIFQSTSASERNKVAQQFKKLAELDKENQFIRRLDEHEAVGRKNVITVLDKGEKIRFEVEPEVYKATLNLDKQSNDALWKILLESPASWLRAGATLTPEFSLRNPIRDINQAFATNGFNPVTDIPVGLAQSIMGKFGKGKLYKQWVEDMGDYGNIISMDRKLYQQSLEKVLKEPVSKKFVNIVTMKPFMSLLRTISDTSESTTKLAVYRSELRKGSSRQEAAYQSRDVMDFGRAGTSIRPANKIVAFLNSSIQGKSKVLRAIKENPAGFTARAFVSTTVPTIGVFIMQKYMANDVQKQSIAEAPNWQKNIFWLVPIPGTDLVARIPKPFDLGLVFATIPERLLNKIFNDDKEAFDGFAREALAQGSVPTQISGLVPLMEGMANYSFFRESNIIPMGEESREFKDQYDNNTTGAAKLLASGADKITGGKGALKNFSSPRIMDNTIKGFTAGLGTYATSFADYLADKMNVTDKPVKPEKGITQQPLAKAFLVNPNQSGKSVEQLYDLREELTDKKGSAKFNNTLFTDQPMLKFITDQTDLMGDITKEIRTIENSRSLDASQKRTKIEGLLKRRNDIAIKAMQMINERR
jgi:hypothetical protein